MRSGISSLAFVLAVLAACAPSSRDEAGPELEDGGAADASAARPPGGDASTSPPDAGEPLPPLRDDAIVPSLVLREAAHRATDDEVLAAAFAADGYALPAEAEVLAARVVDGVSGPAYVYLEAGGGGFATGAFWPASTVKLLAVLGALEHVSELGFTSDAFVRFDSGFGDTLGAIIDRAIRVSSNEDYDCSVRIAGFDRLNDVFLTPERGFAITVIQRSYAGFGVRDVPGFTLDEAGRTHHVPAMVSTAPDRCPPRDGNCTDLFELTEGLRRVMLRSEIPAGERFHVAEADLARVEDALCGATPSFFAAGVERALGPGARVCHKPGWVPDIDCLDHAFIEDPVTGDRYLLAASVPETTGGSSCLPLSAIAEHALLALRDASGTPFQRDAGAPIVVELDDHGTSADGTRDVEVTLDAPGADHVELYLDASPIGAADGDGPRFSLRHGVHAGGDRQLVVVATRDATPVAYRALTVRIAPPE